MFTSYNVKIYPHTEEIRYFRKKTFETRAPVFVAAPVFAGHWDRFFYFLK